VWRLGVAIVVGFVVMAPAWRPSGAGPLGWRAARWLVPYLIGMGVISRLGTFGNGTGDLPVGWDFAVIALFSLAIYYWAMVTRP